ncbi:MAG: LamG domain-containing protein [Gammaproteobacteria bacterium]|uniref:DUF6701 domain-containing protein n=1 Tax=Rhodoferax sp. TaxID=50421 RepID=UPI0017C50AD1|nr:DUF6701 domain-containing protein [Rhodoferax sp.]MBU3898036.1 LamG domain-containing protein [Gammaproteobacteria bacterium]MBA3058535.1 LamG domain-containing protein [Rhodoferax sp.]MBU3999207.1 LamG domain-containing protein [Gammaproteobacteria bacterium]MBU4081770.1 LamG domain-containing protein [Gammaproteobacteria bacterium]MBU4112894.1 LamG domain-containing protein [Gammaproteobacteria bacterium]
MNKLWPHLPRQWDQWIRLLARFLALWACLMAGQSLHAQTYAYRNDVFAYDTPSGSASTVTWHTSGTSPACTGYPNGDDDWADVVFPSGFSFTFGGVNYSGVRVYSNGVLALGNDVSGFHRDYTSQSLPAPADGTYAGCPTAAPVNTMFAYWIDIVAGTANSTSGASVKYELLGAAPNRRFVISWVNVKLYNTTTRYNFQVNLYESSAGLNGNFRYQYTSGSSNGSNATVGVQLSQSDYTQYSYNQQFIDTTNGTAILWYPANQLATKMAEYRFDESAWTGTTGQVKDTSGNNLDASRVGAAANVPDGKLCRGGSFTNNTSNSTIHAVATPIVPGNVGALDFWYYANKKWDTADTMLFDASAVANRPFFLMKRSTGALRFVVTDSAGNSVTANSPSKNFAANTWHHIGVAWSVRVGTNQTTVQIFLDGVLQNGDPSRGTTNGSLPALNTIHIGDNRTSGVTPANGTGNGADGIIDEVYVYPIEISAPQVMADMNLTRPTCTTLDHFHIVHDGAVSNCSSPASITIEAHDADHALFSLAGTSLNLATDLGRGTWSNVAGGAINSLTAIGVGTGSASYTFSGESSVTFGLSHNLSEALNINVGSGGITEYTGTAATCVADDFTFPGGACDVSRTFVCAKPFGFNCMESGAAALSGHLYTKLAGTAFSVDVVALKDADSDGIADAVEAAYASDADKSVTVELVEGSGATACSARAAISPAVSQTLTFSKVNQPTELGRKSTAAMTVGNAYADLRCRVTDANQSPSIVGCSSDSFAVRPPQLTVTAPVLSNATLTGDPKAVAGADFTLDAASGVASGYTGTPVLNTTQVQDHANAAIAAGTLSGAFSAGNGTKASGAVFKYLDVGNIKLLADAVLDSGFTVVDQIGDCVADSTANTLTGGKYGCNIGSAASATMGRWHPSHYSFVGTLTPACGPGGMTYMDQDALGVALTLKAHASTGATASASDPVVSRYTTGYTNLAPVTISGDNGGTPVAVTRLGSPVFPAMPSTASWSAGLFQINNTFAFSKLGAPDGAYDLFKLKAALADPDGSTLIGLPAAQETNTSKIRYGRVQLQNAYGSEYLALPVPLTLQYWNGNWQKNTLDTCTSLQANQFAWSSPAGSATRPNNLAACESAATVAGVSPNYTVTLSAPGVNNAGWADLSLNLAATAVGSTCTTANAGTGNSGLASTVNAPWLQYNWTGALGNPKARATFGVFKSPLIYRRENY